MNQRLTAPRARRTPFVMFQMLVTPLLLVIVSSSAFGRGRRTREEAPEVTAAPSARRSATLDDVDRDVARRALELLRKDAELDDEKFTPPAAIGLAVPSTAPSDETSAR